MEADLKPTEETNSLETLEDPGTTVVANAKAPAAATGKPTPSGLPGKPPRQLKGLLRHVNVYVLGLVLVIVIAVVVTAISFIANRKATQVPTVATQNLTQQQLQQLANSDVSVGNNKQVLNVQSNAVFAGQVLINQDLDVAGTIKVGGSLSLPGLSVSGTSTFSQIQTGNLTVSGNTAIQGQLTASSGLNVAGSATFSGNVSANQLTVSTLTLNGDLNLDHHIDAGGPTPSRSTGTALGSGGTASVSGSDTAGTVNINTGTGTSSGCFITINFTTPFNATPHVVVTPISAAAAGIDYYVNRSTTSMSICATNPTDGQTFAFDYIVFD